MANKEMVEKKTKRGEFSVKIGSTDRINQRVIFFEGTAYISPNYESDDYTKDINEIERFSRQKILDTISETKLFQKDFISNFDVSAIRMKKDKYSCLQFEYYLIQPKNENILTVKDIIKEKLDRLCLKPFEEIEQKLKDFDFTISNKKPKPTK